MKAVQLVDYIGDIVHNFGTVVGCYTRLETELNLLICLEMDASKTKFMRGRGSKNEKSCFLWISQDPLIESSVS